MDGCDGGNALQPRPGRRGLEPFMLELRERNEERDRVMMLVLFDECGEER